MAKNKRKANLAKSTADKKKKTERVNPFEIRFNREKHSVLNRKKKSTVLFKNKDAKNEIVGRPGIARSRAIQKRKETLLQEHKIKNKSNVFIDKRIGEKDTELSAEDKMIARFTAERMKHGKKKNIFNLGEEENLTHYGQSISELEQFDDDPRSDDEADQEASKKLDAEQHFGGFLTQSDMEFSSGKSNSRREWIENMIADSKKRKFEQQKNKEDTLKMTQDLDQQWKDMAGGLRTNGTIYTKKEDVDNDDNNEETDEYNRLMKELVFEPKKAKAQDRLKTDEEIVKETKERLELLEQLRVQRMKGDTELDDEEEMEEDKKEENDENGEESDNEEDENDNDEDENDNDEDEDDDDDDKDEYSDLEESEDEREQVTTPQSKSKQKQQKSKQTTAKMDYEEESAVEASEGAMKKEIPFTFTVPRTFEVLQELFEDRTSKEKVLIIERMIQCNHPQFGNDNKSRLEDLFRFLLQFIHDSACLDEEDEDIEEQLDCISGLTPFLYDLAKFSPQPSGEAVRSVLQEKFEDYVRSSRNYPTFEALIFLKITTLLFPSSDYRHPVTTPALQWMSHILSTARPFSRKALASGVFIASIFVESLSLSKKFSPELMNFLTGIIFMAIPKDKATVISYIPPFKVVGSESTLLADILKSKIQPGKLKYQDCISKENLDEKFAATILNTSLELLNQTLQFWNKFPSSAEIVHRLKEEFLPKISFESFHSSIQANITKLKSTLGEFESKISRSHTIPKRKKEIKMLRLYDPELEEHFDPFQKKRGGPKSEESKLKHKIKREQKGAKKDLRADTAFLAKQKAKERRDKDSERMQKTKAIMSGLGSQEGEFREFQRQKGGKKSKSKY